MKLRPDQLVWAVVDQNHKRFVKKRAGGFVYVQRAAAIAMAKRLNRGVEGPYMVVEGYLNWQNLPT